jgi:hypothetical protein
VRTTALRTTALRTTALALGLTAAGMLCAQTPPDFSGVYYPVNPFGNFRGGPAAGGAAPERKGPPPPPKASAPLADGSTGRRPDEPALKPEYLAKWQMISKTLIAGSSQYDPVAKCLPPGMPAMMSMFYGMEVMQNKDKITFFSELNDALRRVYLDGRKPSQKVLDDPTYAGYSTGRWEGATLVVDTVALREDTFIEGFTPHSDAMAVHERIRFKEPGLLEDTITVNDPKALTKPWETVKTYRKANPGTGTDELREFACAEGISEVK